MIAFSITAILASGFVFMSIIITLLEPKGGLENLSPELLEKIRASSRERELLKWNRQ